jgi:hypothetical protein
MSHSRIFVANSQSCTSWRRCSAPCSMLYNLAKSTNGVNATVKTRRQADNTSAFAWRSRNFDRHFGLIRMAPPRAGLKDGLKAVGQAISKPQFINIPRLGTPVNYAAWLTCLLNTPRNQHAAKRSMKSDIDELLHRQAGKQFKNNNELLQKALTEVNTTFDKIPTSTDTSHRPRRKPVRMPGTALKLDAKAR